LLVAATMTTKLKAATRGPSECVTDPHPASTPTSEAEATERAAAAYLVAGLPAPDASPSPAHFVPLVEFLSRG